jgi:hypothetical protein
VSLLPELCRQYPWLALAVGDWTKSYPGDRSDLESAALAGLAYGEQHYDPTRGMSKANYLHLTVWTACKDEVKRTHRWWQGVQTGAAQTPRMIHCHGAEISSLPWSRLKPQERCRLLAWLSGESQDDIARREGVTPAAISYSLRSAVHVLAGGRRGVPPRRRSVNLQYPRQAHRGRRSA